MVFSAPLLHDAMFQLTLCTPVMVVGWLQFGRSAWRSLRAGFPNMDVLITIGSSSAYFYSLAGTWMYRGTPAVHEHLFYETAASIVTLIFAGNLIEQRAVRQTTSSIRSLTLLQPETAKKLSSEENGAERIENVKVSLLHTGDLVRVNEGDRIPVDGKILSGSAWIDESLLTGESIPVSRKPGDNTIAGSLCTGGALTIEVSAVGKATTLSRIIAMVKDAQHDKPSIQRLGDRVSAIFVPAVVGISLITFIISTAVLALPLSEAVMHAVAVLVISCPCAMGLATPTAVMVGIGRAARSGILIKGGSTVEELAGVKTVVFDKTGTLTTGRFRMVRFNVIEGDEQELRRILLSLEKNSSHPIAKAVVERLQEESGDNLPLVLTKIQEDKGIGINGWDADGRLYSAGSYTMAQHLTQDDTHGIYVLKDNRLVGIIDIEDDVKPDAAHTVSALRKAGIRVVLLSGDRREVCEAVARQTGIDEVHFRKSPGDKTEIVRKLSAEGPTAMVGDGINDAPALARASVGISLGGATDVAMDSAKVVLLRPEETTLLLNAISISRHTYSTIRQNLFWAFLYNVLAIPFAAAGYLSPMIGALSMAFSDVIVIGNSLRLNVKKIDNRL
jgi:Cu+-exporting ATPase